MPISLPAWEQAGFAKKPLSVKLNSARGGRRSRRTGPQPYGFARSSVLPVFLMRGLPKAIRPCAHERIIPTQPCTQYRLACMRAPNVERVFLGIAARSCRRTERSLRKPKCLNKVFSSASVMFSRLRPPLGRTPRSRYCSAQRRIDAQSRPVWTRAGPAVSGHRSRPRAAWRAAPARSGSTPSSIASRTLPVNPLWR